MTRHREAETASDGDQTHWVSLSRSIPGTAPPKPSDRQSARPESQKNAENPAPRDLCVAPDPSRHAKAKGTSYSHRMFGSCAKDTAAFSPRELCSFEMNQIEPP